MVNQKKLIHTLLGLNPGNITVTRIRVEEWGSDVIFDCVYQYPPVERRVRVIFENCRSLEWYVQRTGTDLHGVRQAQLLTHDLGEGNYQRTARMATTLAEVIIGYGRLKLEVDD